MTIKYLNLITVPVQYHSTGFLNSGIFCYILERQTDRIIPALSLLAGLFDTTNRTVGTEKQGAGK
jgi:hypothetical protein